jgi:hypothetical protein
MDKRRERPRQKTIYRLAMIWGGGDAKEKEAKVTESLCAKPWVPTIKMMQGPTPPPGASPFAD